MKSLIFTAGSIKNALAGLRLERLSRMLSTHRAKRPENKKQDATLERFPYRSLASG